MQEGPSKLSLLLLFSWVTHLNCHFEFLKFSPLSYPLLKLVCVFPDCIVLHLLASHFRLISAYLSLRWLQGSQHYLLQNLSPKRLPLSHKAAPRSVGRNEIESHWQTHQCRFRRRKELKDIARCVTKATNRLVLWRTTELPSK